MKIIHNELTEYGSLVDLQKAFHDMPHEMKKTGVILLSNKNEAESNLKYQIRNFNTLGARCFWWYKGEYNGVITYILVEAIRD